MKLKVRILATLALLRVERSTKQRSTLTEIRSKIEFVWNISLLFLLMFDHLSATSSARKAVVKPRFYLFSKHFDVLAYLKHVNVSEFPVLFPRPTNEEEEFPGLPPDVGRLVIGHVVAKHPMPIATEKLDSSSTDSSGAVRNLLHLNKIAHF